MRCEPHGCLSRFGKQVNQITGKLHRASQDLGSDDGEPQPKAVSCCEDRDTVFIPQLHTTIVRCIVWRYWKGTSSDATGRRGLRADPDIHLPLSSPCYGRG